MCPSFDSETSVHVKRGVFIYSKSFFSKVKLRTEYEENLKHFAALFLCNLAMITHNATLSVNFSCY